MPTGVRTALPEDLPGIISLYSRVYPKISQEVLKERAQYLQLLLFENPWRSLDFSSIVYEDKSGHIIGFLGVIPRPMIFHDQPVTMTVSNNYMVDPMSRNSMAGIGLAKAFFSTGQNFTICQPRKGPSQQVWKAFGARAPLAYGLSWVWPLRPLSYFVSRLNERQFSPTVTALMRPASTMIDGVAKKYFAPQVEIDSPTTRREHLTIEELLVSIEECSRQYSLRPVYDLNTLKWLQDLLLLKRQHGELRVQGVCTTQGSRIGYYVYYAQPDGASFVVQIGARPGSFAAVLNELGSDALERGASALSGWVDSRNVEAISARAYYLKHREDPLFVYSRDSNILLNFEKGDAFCTALESEWWTWFPSAPLR